MTERERVGINRLSQVRKLLKIREIGFNSFSQDVLLARAQDSIPCEQKHRKYTAEKPLFIL
jgi:hypothetical protein